MALLSCICHSNPFVCSFVFLEWCKVGLAICYDVRFSELASIYAQKG